MTDFQPSDRVFIDRMTQFFVDKIVASAKNRGGILRWVRLNRAGPTGRPYQVRMLAVCDGNAILAVAYPNRAGAIRWRTPWAGVESYEIEQETGL